MVSKELAYDNDCPVVASYLSNVLRKRFLFLFIGCLTFFVVAVSLLFGTYQINFSKIVRVLLGFYEGKEAIVLWNVRIPRVIAALSVGSGLALSGVCIQTLLRNSLASPSTLGISQGAAFGAALAIILFKGTVLSVSLFAFVGAISVTVFVVFLERLRNLSPEAMILAGVALSSLFGAGTTVLHYITDETQLARAIAWTFGDVGRSSWIEIAFVCGAVVFLFIFCLINSWKFTAFEAGEETALSLGVSTVKIRWQGLILASLVAALATAFHGIIAFVGLVAPHIARRLCGSDHRFLVFFTFLIGALLLVGADTFGRLVIGSASFPVGITTSFLGAPLFMYLLVRREKKC